MININKIYRKLKNTSAFSLIELMVVVAILSFVVLGLVTFFGGGVRSWISGQNQLEAQREARMAVDRMVREIRMANKVVSGYENGLEISYPTVFAKENVSFDLDLNTGSVMRNNINPLIDHIPGGGFTIEYYDSESNEVANSATASKIKLILQVDVDGDNKIDIEIETEVNLRNYGV